MNERLIKLKLFIEYYQFVFASIRHSFALRKKQNNLSKIKKGDIILVAVLKDEAVRLPFFFEYYENLGVDHFIIVDNNSSDDFANTVKGRPNVSTFFTKASYRKAHYGMHWANYLLRKYGVGHWCITCDPDEFLVYQNCDTRDLRALTGYLEANGRDSLFSVMVDMYGKGTVDEFNYTAGQNPVEICPYFDKVGYSKVLSPVHNSIFIHGGVRRRMFFGPDPQKAPAINKVPLVNWRRGYLYKLSMHVLHPGHLSRYQPETDITGALLHFKFFSLLREKITVELKAKQHWNASFEYKKYSEGLKDQQVFFHESVSEYYTDWRSLIGPGLINVVDW